MQLAPNEGLENIHLSIQGQSEIFMIVLVFLAVTKLINFWICKFNLICFDFFIFSGHDADSSAAAAPARTLPTSSISRRRATWLRFDEKQNILETLNPST